MINFKCAFPILLAAGLLAGCAAPGLPPAYLHALEDAAIPEPDEESHSLISLAPGAPGIIERTGANGQRDIRMAMFTTADTVKQYYSQDQGSMPPGKPRVWVTAAPQMQAMCKASGLKGEALRQRLVQWLGLPPNAQSDSVVEMWIPADSLLRPCADPATNGNTCSATAAAAPTAPGVADYPSFFAGLFVGSYSVKGAPWTRLGYTYDWGRQGHGTAVAGGSEFMVAPSTAYTVAGRWSFEAYCAP